jgi:hypothetical protein
LKTRLHGKRFISSHVPWQTRMNTHMKGRDPARAPARAGKPKAGEKTTRRERVMWGRCRHERHGVGRL